MTKRMTSLALLTVVLGLALVMAGCNLNKTSIEDRIDMFIADVQAGSTAGLYEHFHGSSTTYVAARTGGATFWTTTPFTPADAPHTFTSISYGDPTSIATYESGGSSPATTSVTIDMREEDKDDWYIRSITFNDGAPYVPNLN